MSELLDGVLERLDGVREVNGGYQAKCPAHEDGRASLSISESEGRILVHCHAGCDSSAVVEKIGFTMKDLFPKRATSPFHSRIVEAYDYRDAGGVLLFQAVRFDPKDFRQRKPDGHGGWVYNLHGVQPVPYRLPQVVEAIRRGEAIFMPEGEKDVHTLESLGLAATCNPGGAGKWRKSYAEHFNGAKVVVLPDNDAPGRKHAQDVAVKLTGAAASVKIVELPGLPLKGDVTDWVHAGHTREELLTVAEQSPEGTPPVSDHNPSPKLGEGPAAPKDFPLTDLGNAERLIAAHGVNLRYDVDRGKWLVWNGMRWDYDVTAEVDRRAMQTIRALYDLLKDLDRAQADALYSHIKKSESAPRLAAIVELAHKLQGVPVQAGGLDHDLMLLNCLNGTVDLRTGTLRPHTREDMITKLTPTEYNPNAVCARWIQFLSEVFEGDAEVTAFVKRMAGYMLTGDTREESLFVLTGKGQNGKSKFVEALRAVMGDYAADTPFTTFLEERDSNTSDLAGLMGKRLVTASEAPSGGYRGREEGTSFNESVLKQCTGGDPVTCRHLYREFFTYTPTYKVLFSTNEVPRLRSQNYAMRRRLKLVPFRVRFHDPQDGKQPVKDDRLLEKLLAEKNGILAWAVQGCLEWQTRGLDTPAAIRAEVDRLFESQDPLAEFIEERCEVLPGAEIAKNNLWADYKAWCEQTCRKPAFKQMQGFTRSLTQRDGIDDARRAHGTVRVYTGITLKGDTGDAESDFSANLPMKDLHGSFSENTENPSPPSPPERECWEDTDEADPFGTE